MQFNNYSGWVMDMQHMLLDMQHMLSDMQHMLLDMQHMCVRVRIKLAQSS